MSIMPLPKLPEPVKVSPTIKFFRYALLIAGFFYGSSRRAYVKRKEAHYKEKQQKLKAERDAKLAQEKKIASEKELAELAQIFTPTPPETSTKTHSVSYEDQSLEEQTYYTGNLNGNTFEECLAEEPRRLDKPNVFPKGSVKSSITNKDFEDFTTQPINLSPKVEESKDTTAENSVNFKETTILVEDNFVTKENTDYTFLNQDDKQSKVETDDYKFINLEENESNKIENIDKIPFEPVSQSDEFKNENIDDYVEKKKQESYDVGDFNTFKWDAGYFFKDYSKEFPVEPPVVIPETVDSPQEEEESRSDEDN